MSRLFDQQNTLFQDNCEVEARVHTNKSIADYRLFNNYLPEDCNTCNDNKLNEFVTSNQNLRYKNGVGNIPPCSVDIDSELRNKFQMGFKGRDSLCTRWYTAVPNLGRGGLIPNVESRLKMNEDTSDIRDCDRITEKDFNRFIPLPGCMANTIQNADNIVEKWTRGGEFTRDYVRDDTYLKKCGFVNDGKLWRRA